MHLYKVVVRETLLDFYGHLNNANYLVLLEEARWELITSKNYGVGTIKKLQKGPVILEVDLKFKKEIKARDIIEIQTSILEYDSMIGKMKQDMINQNGELCATATLVFGLFDLEKRKLIHPTEEWKKALDI